MDLDDTDRALLKLIQADSNVPVKRLAERVGLSTTACWNRIRSLEERKVIIGRVALVDPVKVGVGLCVFVSIRTREHSSDWLAQFANKVSAMHEVVEFYRMAGDVDYMLRVLVSDMAAFDRFYKALIADTSLADVTSRFAMEQIKLTTAVPIDQGHSG
ncbi:MAG: Lrp/AsnC family transcriptional regulator [Chromatiales bacterium]|jgi:Lrp/AsnC family transcriptional regulator|nr:Lrp/AsnC family transcriptional regulator [Chromatiales bacterium]